MTISGQKSKTDWERVRKSIEMDEPIPYDTNDPDDGPCDPNDEAAVDTFMSKATIWRGYPNPVMIQKDGVPVNQDDASATAAKRTRAKAS